MTGILVPGSLSIVRQLLAAGLVGSPVRRRRVPGADWIVNVRAADGRAALSTHVDAEDEPVVLVELPADEARPILEAWPDFVPQGVAIMVENGVAAAPTPDALGELAGICPVFRIDPAGPRAVNAAR